VDGKDGGELVGSDIKVHSFARSYLDEPQRRDNGTVVGACRTELTVRCDADRDVMREALKVLGDHRGTQEGGRLFELAVLLSFTRERVRIPSRE